MFPRYLLYLQWHHLPAQELHFVPENILHSAISIARTEWNICKEKTSDFMIIVSNKSASTQCLSLLSAISFPKAIFCNDTILQSFLSSGIQLKCTFVKMPLGCLWDQIYLLILFYYSWLISGFECSNIIIFWMTTINDSSKKVYTYTFQFFVDTITSIILY